MHKTSSSNLTNLKLVRSSSSSSSSSSSQGCPSPLPTVSQHLQGHHHINPFATASSSLGKSTIVFAEAGFARAVLAARRRGPCTKSHCVSVVQTLDGVNVDYGEPSEWKAGIAQRVMAGELVVHSFSLQLSGVESSLSRSASSADEDPHQGEKASVQRIDSSQLANNSIDEENAIFFHAGYVSDQGPCPYQQDDSLVIRDLNDEVATKGPPCAYFAVYDGHSGEDSVRYARHHLHRIIAQHPMFHVDPEIAIREGFQKFDSRLIEKSRKMKIECGVVAVAALLRGNNLYVGHAGDCRAVLCRNGAALELTVDHKADREDERKAIEQNGGYVKDGRVCGALAVSRSLGDYEVEHDCKLRGLRAEPDIRTETICEQDEFLLLASDGIFDVVTTAEAVACVKDSLGYDGDPKEAATKLMWKALEKNTQDNCTVLVVTFKDAPPPQPVRRRFVFTKKFIQHLVQEATTTITTPAESSQQHTQG